MGDTNKDLEDIAKNATEDFYELLGVAFDAPEAAIKKAYRKASIKYHPDKNPDNKDAADRFIYLGWARDILLDAKLKGEYDRARTRRRERVLQDELLDGRRLQMKQDLERREAAAKDAAQGLKRKRGQDLNDAEKREQEIQRLAEDGKRRRHEAQERLNQKRREEENEAHLSRTPEATSNPTSTSTSSEIDRTIKIRFPRTSTTEAWDKSTLAQMFSKFGPIDSVVLAKDKKVRPSGEKHRKITATAFIIYTRIDHAHAAVSDARQTYASLESVSWAGSEPDININIKPAPSAPSTPVNKTFRASFSGAPALGTPTPTHTPIPKFSFSPKPGTPSLQEVTMMRLKEAEKRRLEEQIRKQEAAEEAATELVS